MTSIAVGIDAGGTSTRCLAVDLTGNRVGWARGPGANVNSSGDAERAVRSVLEDVVRAGTRIEALVFAAAGAGPSGAPRAIALAQAVTAGFGVARLVVHSDVEAAFAAGSIAADGTVLVAGTGAVAAAVRGFRIASRQDGHGYLLGDRGSAFWIGAEAARAVLAHVDGSGEPTALRAAVQALVRGDAAVAQRSGCLSEGEAIEAAVYAHPPAWLGTLAPLVESAATHGDPVALRIVETAVAELVTTAAHVHDGGPLIVTGAVATSAGLLGQRVRAGLNARLHTEPVVVHDASVGAAALALRAVPGVDTAVVERLVTSG